MVEGAGEQWVWRWLGLAAMMAALVATFVLAFHVLLLLFGGCLFALVLRGASDWLAKQSPMSPKLALALVVLLFFAACAGASMWLGPKLIEQVAQMRQELPALLEDVLARLVDLGFEPETLEEAMETDGKAVVAQGGAAFSLSARSLIYLLIVLISGVYLAFEPGIYVRGLLRLVSPARRNRMQEVLQQVGLVLHRFLVGRLVSMAAVGVATGVGLALFGVPLAVLLATLAGLLTFVPYAGPIVAAAPIALVAMTLGGTGKLVGVLAFYTAVQSIEGFVITPLVQKKVVALPPVLTLASELVFGTLFGPLGIIVSVPLAAAGIVIVRELYVLDHLEQPARAERPHLD